MKALVKVTPRVLYIRMVKRGSLRLSQCEIRKYGHHIESVIMSDEKGIIVANYHDFYYIT